MQKIRITIVLLFLSLATLSAQHPTGTLTIHTKDFKNNDGIVIVSLFRENDEMPKKPWRKERGTIVDGKSTIRFENIPYGAYAVILFHDENSNEELDHKFFLPAEPMGFSNGWSVTLFSGMPNFEKLRFEVSEKLNEYIIGVVE